MLSNWTIYINNIHFPMLQTSLTYIRSRQSHSFDSSTLATSILVYSQALQRAVLRVDIIISFLNIFQVVVSVFAVLTAAFLRVTGSTSLKTYAISVRAFAPWASAVLQLCGRYEALLVGP